MEPLNKLTEWDSRGLFVFVLCTEILKFPFGFGWV